MVLVHLIELKSLSSEPIPFSLHVDEAGLLLGLDALNIGLLFQISHVLLHDVHLLLKRCKKVTLVLVHYAFYVLSSILDLLIHLIIQAEHFTGLGWVVFIKKAK